MTKKWTIWTVAVALIVSIIVGINLDAHIFLAENDFTYISFVSILLLFGFTINCTVQAFRSDYKTSDMQWFIADSVLSLGMVGTLAGFLVVLYSTFQGLDVADTDSMKKAIETLATGMGTALLTSLVGLVSSIIMKFQLVTLEKEYEEVLK